MRTELIPYQRISDVADKLEGTDLKRMIVNYLNPASLILILSSFLIGRGSLVQGLLPFGMAFYVSMTGNKISKFFIGMLILFGMYSAGAREQLYLTAAAFILYNAASLFVKDLAGNDQRYLFASNGVDILTGLKDKKQNIKLAIAAFSCVIAPELVQWYFKGMLLYDLIIALYHSIIVFTLVFVFRNAIYVLKTLGKGKACSNEDVISSGIAISIALSGFGAASIAGFGIKNVTCVLVILILSYILGPTVGAASGVTAGLILNLTSDNAPLMLGAYAFCGLLSGIFGKIGKVGATLGFIVGNAVYTLYVNGSLEVIVYFREILAASLVFIIIPGKFMMSFRAEHGLGLQEETSNSGYGNKVKDITVEKLNKFSDAFKELAKTFSEISVTKAAVDKKDIATMFDRVADKVCKGCGLCPHCWDRNFFSTYQLMFTIIEKIDEKGWIDQSDVPPFFIERCERINEFVKEVNNIYEIFKVDMVWKSKIDESRGLVSQQMEGLSKVVSNLANEINKDIKFKHEFEEIIHSELRKAGLQVSKVTVWENKWGKYQIGIVSKGCGGRRVCVGNIVRRVSNITKRKMVKTESECCYNQNCGSCTVNLVEEEAYRITVGTAKIAKNESKVSGDNYTFMKQDGGRYLLALSDGMGTGHKASTNSKATINLLEQFMESGFDKDTTVKLINSILVLRSSDDSFATIDLAIVDLYEGAVEFIKVGAVPSFIKKSEGVEVIKSVTLPAGIFENIETELMKRTVNDGEFLIMITDGILDAFRETGEDKSFSKFVDDIDSINPQDIADKILGEACKISGGEPRDDMMVLVAKLWKLF